MNLFEKLNRLDDSLVESKRVVSESLVGRQAKPTNRNGRVLWNMPTLTVLRVAEVDENNTPRYYVRDEESGEEYITDLRSLWIIDAATNPITPKDLEDDLYDDEIDEMLTEDYPNEMTRFMNWIQEYRNGALWNDFTAEFEAEQDPDISDVLTWLENFDEDAYYDYIDADDMLEGLFSKLRHYQLTVNIDNSLFSGVAGSNTHGLRVDERDTQLLPSLITAIKSIRKSDAKGIKNIEAKRWGMGDLKRLLVIDFDAKDMSEAEKFKENVVLPKVAEKTNHYLRLNDRKEITADKIMYTDKVCTLKDMTR